MRRLAPHARVLLRLPAWLGDFVMSEPLVRALDAHLERGALTLVGRAAHLELLAGRFPRARRLPIELGGAVTRAWRGHDAAFLATGSFRSAWMAFRAGIPQRVGLARDGRRWLLSDACRPALERGRTPLGLGLPGRGARYLPRPLERSLTELAGLAGVVARDQRPRLEVQDEWRAQARARRARLGLGPEERFLLANVGARPGSAKGVPPALWGRFLADLARECALPVLLAGGPGEESAVAETRALFPRAQALLEPAAGLPELAAHLEAAELVLTADAGPRHVARALGARLLVLAGPTDPRHTAGERADEILVRVAVPCGPCHRERCGLAEPRRHACMRELSEEALLRGAESLLARPRSAILRA